MAQVSLEAKADTWVKRLSGGQRQRLAVATALVGDPELIFLDEPTTGPDPQSRRQLWDIICDYRERGRSVLLTTHYMDEAERLCDRVAIVDQGKIITLGTPDELIRKIGGEHVVEFSVNEHQTMGIAAEELQKLPSVSGVQMNSDHALLTVKSPHVAIPALLNRLQQDRLEFNRLTTRHASLEDVFVSLTGRSLADEEQAEVNRPMQREFPLEPGRIATASKMRGWIVRTTLSLFEHQDTSADERNDQVSEYTPQQFNRALQRSSGGVRKRPAELRNLRRDQEFMVTAISGELRQAAVPS